MDADGPRYRLRWEVDGRQGHGDWSSRVALLVVHAENQNKRHGEGTHWVETREEVDDG